MVPTRRSSVLTTVVLTALALLAVVSCSSDDDSDEAATTGTGTAAGGTTTVATSALSGSITVMAPGPLKNALEQAKASFEADHPGVTVNLSLGHVPTLLAQLEEGVPGDVLVTPDEGTMGQAEDKGLIVVEPLPVARNELTLVVPADNPGEVQGVDALGDADLSVAVCAAELPCGKLTEQLATKAGITLEADSLDPGGSPAIVTKASTGEIDVGVVFAVDVQAGGDKVTAVSIPADVAVSSQVMAAALESSQNTAVAEAFLAFLASPEGQSLFVDAGFTAL
ncbi:MAG: molybdate ABC transporter substrate-binding protein [Acidimicrobiales bacterium]|nr:molybdate ABC transporter substrate-binding protein [Acidimicrobiales bacterium]